MSGPARKARNPWRIRPRVSTTSTALLGNRPCGEGGRGLHEMNPCLFQSPAGAASTFEPLCDPSARHTVSRTISLFRRAVGGFLGLTDSRGSHLWWLPFHPRALPSPCTLIIAEGRLLVKGFSEVSENFLSSPYYLIHPDNTRADCRLPTRFLAMVVNPLGILGSSSTLPRGACLLHSDQRLAGLTVLREFVRWKACTSPLGVPLLGSQRASLGGAGVRIPS